MKKGRKTTAKASTIDAPVLQPSAASRLQIPTFVEPEKTAEDVSGATHTQCSANVTALTRSHVRSSEGKPVRSRAKSAVIAIALAPAADAMDAKESTKENRASAAAAAPRRSTRLSLAVAPSKLTAADYENNDTAADASEEKAPEKKRTASKRKAPVISKAKAKKATAATTTAMAPAKEAGAITAALSTTGKQCYRLHRYCHCHLYHDRHHNCNDRYNDVHDHRHERCGHGTPLRSHRFRRPLRRCRASQRPSQCRRLPQCLNLCRRLLLRRPRPSHRAPPQRSRVTDH